MTSLPDVATDKLVAEGAVGGIGQVRDPQLKYTVQVLRGLTRLI